MTRVEDTELRRWRALPANQLLMRVATFAKRDGTFEPVKSTGTERWHANVEGREYELVTDGPKFFDTRAKRGGGGAVDLVMHVHHLDFQAATALVRLLGV